MAASTNSGGGSLTVQTDAPPAALNGNIGSDWPTYFLHGRVDDLAVYNTALSADTLYLHYELGLYG